MNLSVFCQTILKADTTSNKKAKYLKEDLTKFLIKNTRYPKDKTGNFSEGDVVYSFIVNKNGQLENLQLEDSPDNLFSESTHEALIKLDQSWSPAKINHVLTDKSYTIVFRYRVYSNDKNAEYKSQIAGFVKRQKFDQAIKLLDIQISENPYDFKLLRERAKLKDLVGDKEGAIEDYNLYDKLNADIMLVVNVVSYGASRTARGIGFP